MQVVHPESSNWQCAKMAGRQENCSGYYTWIRDCPIPRHYYRSVKPSSRPRLEFGHWFLHRRLWFSTRNV